MIIRAIDGGGTGFRRADIVDGRVRNATRNTPIRNLKHLLAFATQKLLPGTQGIAYAVAGLIKKHDLVVKSPNISFLNGVRLATRTSEKSDKNSAVFNDMEAAVTGMAALLPAEPYFLGITWSSGIGLRVWDRGRLLEVAEGGHSLLDPSPFAPLCGCGKLGHVEAIVGGLAVGRRVVAELQTLQKKLPKGDPCEYLMQCHDAGEPWAVRLGEMVAKGMGFFIANVQSLLHLPLIVWKGTFGLEVLKRLEPAIRKAMKTVAVDPSWVSRKALRFFASPKPKDDQLVGAAKCFEHLRRPPAR